MDQSIRLRRPDEQPDASPSRKTNFAFATGSKDAIPADPKGRRFKVVHLGHEQQPAHSTTEAEEAHGDR